MPLNALTLVNLAMGLGIAVEFQAHLLHAFLVLDPAASRPDRAEAALADVGASILSGITLTKFAGRETLHRPQLGAIMAHSSAMSAGLLFLALSPVHDSPV